jgi:hypothetical protein
MAREQICDECAKITSDVHNLCDKCYIKILRRIEKVEREKTIMSCSNMTLALKMAKGVIEEEIAKKIFKDIEKELESLDCDCIYTTNWEELKKKYLDKNVKSP